MTTASIVTADDVELPDSLPVPDRTWVARLPVIAIAQPPERMAAKKRERGQPVRNMLHVAWEALSFEYDFNPEIFEDNYEHVWLPIYTNDGAVMGPYTQFGQVFDAFKGLGYPLTKNEVFRPQLEGKIFKVKTVEEKYKRGDGTEGRSFNVIPIEELATYTIPTERRKVRRGYGGGSIATIEVTADQIAALKVALHGKTEDEYSDAIMDSGEATIMVDPFLGEAADGGRLTRRLTGYGGKVMAGRIFFEELES